MNRLWLAAAVVAVLSALPYAQSKEELVADGKNTDNVTTAEHGLRPQELQPAHANQHDRTSSGWCRSGAPAS